MACNPDMQGCIPQIMQLLDQVHSGQQQLLQLWQIKKVKLEQCLQLRIFEQDCEKVITWLISQKPNRDTTNLFWSQEISLSSAAETERNRKPE